MPCPAYDCSGGHAGRVYEIHDPASVQLPADVAAAKGDKKLWRCSYCGFLWFSYLLTDGSRPLRMQLPVGYYDNFTQPGAFFATPNHRLKAEPVAKSRKRR